MAPRSKPDANDLERTTDTETVTLRDAISIAIPVIALVIILAIPGEPRWVSRPWFIKGPPRRGPLAAFFTAFLLLEIARVVL